MDGTEHASQRPKQKFLDQIRDMLRVLEYAKRTEDTYIHWIRRFILFHEKRHPQDMGVAEVEAFLTYLAAQRQVAAQTQNQALAALSFLYRDVIRHEQTAEYLAKLYVKRPQSLPTILAKKEVHQLLDAVAPGYQLPVRLIYGAGLRVLECVRLRVKDVDLTLGQVLVRNDKGFEDRFTILPEQIRPLLDVQLRYARAMHDYDVRQGHDTVYLPPGLLPTANSPTHQECDKTEWGWKYVFPAAKLSVDPRSGVTQRHHLDESRIQRAVREAADVAGLTKPANCRTLRHSFATHLLEDGYDIR